jgi:hypothetical protein
MQLAAEAFGALTHAEEAEVTTDRSEGAFLIKPAPVVFDAEVKLASFHMQLDPDPAGGSVLESVGDGLLGDAEQVLLVIVGERPGVAGDVDIDLDAGAGGPQFRAGLEGGAEVLTL